MKSQQSGFAHAFLIIGLIIALIGSLGFVFWQNIVRPDVTNNEASPKDNSQTSSKEFCFETGGRIEKNGLFCSEDLGVSFNIPKVFEGKLVESDNYDIQKGPMDVIPGASAGQSSLVYSGELSSGREMLSLTIAKEPLRSGYASIGHSLQTTYFDAQENNLHLVDGPTRIYDSKTDTYESSGTFSVGESVPSFIANGIKIYRGTIGDAGVTEDGYLMVINNSLVIVKIRHVSNMGGVDTIDQKQPFADLYDSLKQIKVASDE